MEWKVGTKDTHLIMEPLCKECSTSLQSQTANVILVFFFFLDSFWDYPCYVQLSMASIDFHGNY